MKNLWTKKLEERNEIFPRSDALGNDIFCRNPSHRIVKAARSQLQLKDDTWFLIGDERLDIELEIKGGALPILVKAWHFEADSTRARRNDVECANTLNVTVGIIEYTLSNAAQKNEKAGD